MSADGAIIDALARLGQFVLQPAAAVSRRGKPKPERSTEFDLRDARGTPSRPGPLAGTSRSMRQRRLLDKGIFPGTLINRGSRRAPSQEGDDGMPPGPVKRIVKREPTRTDPPLDPATLVVRASGAYDERCAREA